MGKFNVLGEKGTKLGAALLNEASKELKTASYFDISLIDLDLIDPSEDNDEMSLNDIDELAQSILDNGLDQNLVVIPKENGRYKLMSGHRRRMALLSLVQQGHPEYAQAPCLVKDLSAIPFDISEAGKERLSVLTTNIQRRNNTLKDNLALMKLADEVFEEIRNSGENIGKRREWIAEQLGLSKSTVRNLTFIDSNAAEEVKTAIEEDKLSVTVATEIAHLPTDEQAEILEKTEDISALSVTEVKNYTTQKKEKKAVETEKNGLPFIYGGSDIDKITNSFNNLKYKALKDTVILSSSEYAKAQQAHAAITKQIEKLEKVIAAAKKRYENEK